MRESLITPPKWQNGHECHPTPNDLSQTQMSQSSLRQAHIIPNIMVLISNSASELCGRPSQFPSKMAVEHSPRHLTVQPYSHLQPVQSVPVVPAYRQLQVYEPAHLNHIVVADHG